jgi:integrase
VPSALTADMMFTLLTWARTGEVRFAIWSEFEGLDESDRRLLWRVPAERMKMREEHLVPLSRQAEALVRERYLRAGKGRFVFGSSDLDQPMSENTMLYACYRMGYHRRPTVHGFRGLASTWANESGRYRPDWIEVALAHDCGDKVRAAYNSARYLDSRRSMLQDWADYIGTLGERKRTLNLVPATTVGISTRFQHGLSLLGHNWG